MTALGSIAEWQDIAKISKNLPFGFRPQSGRSPLEPFYLRAVFQ
jgi:hypothetical protein